MISTAEFKDIPATLIHRITGEINIDKVKNGTDISVKILDSTIKKSGTINFIIDAKEGLGHFFDLKEVKGSLL